MGAHYRVIRLLLLSFLLAEHSHKPSACRRVPSCLTKGLGPWLPTPRSLIPRKPFARMTGRSYLKRSRRSSVSDLSGSQKHTLRTSSTSRCAWAKADSPEEYRQLTCRAEAQEGSSFKTIGEGGDGSAEMADRKERKLGSSSENGVFDKCSEPIQKAKVVS